MTDLLVIFDVDGTLTTTGRGHISEPPPLVAGAATGLVRLRRAGATLSVATGMSRVGFEAFVRAHGLQRLLTSCQCADGHPSKPHPSMIERILLETATHPGDAVMVGDTTFDMEMAARAGIGAFGVTWGHHGAAALEAAGAVAVFDVFEDLADRLERLSR